MLASSGRNRIRRKHQGVLKLVVGGLRKERIFARSYVILVIHKGEIAQLCGAIVCPNPLHEGAGSYYC